MEKTGLEIGTISLFGRLEEYGIIKSQKASKHRMIVLGKTLE
jgi:hypothetical protein